MPRDSSTPLRSARNDLSAVLLAGGESRRMGTDKATFLFRGKPLWQVQLETLQKLEPKEIFVSARIDPAWRGDDVLFVADVSPSRGPLSGLAAALDRTTTSHLLALAIDMPCMSNEYLEFLCAQIEPGCGVLPTIDQRAEPLSAIYPREAATDVSKALTNSDFSLQSLTRELVAVGKLQLISVKDRERNLFLNVNEPSDL
jgi:molybdopterin-guanine dinucleotide biosynthesis protein A